MVRGGIFCEVVLSRPSPQMSLEAVLTTGCFNLGNNIRIAKDELVRLNRSSIQLADESGDSWGTLEVYHHLHCLVGLSARSMCSVSHYCVSFFCKRN